MDTSRIGIIGICGWGGIALNAAAADTRIKATVASTMYDMTRVSGNGYFENEDKEESRHAAREAMAKQRLSDPMAMAGGVIDPLPEDAPQFVKDYFDYYKTERSYHERSGNSNDGKTTLAENIADLGGMEIAFEAYTNRLKRQGFEGEQLRLQQQRFYLAFAHLWQSKYNALYAQERTVGRNQYGAGKDEHSLERERINGVAMNTDAWYNLFNVKPGDKLYLKPEERTHIW